jgi:signal transduction histidine kinase
VNAAGLAFAGGYLLVGLLWILLSDALAHRLFSGTAGAHLQTWKGIAFVAASAVFVYVAHSLQPDVPEDVPANLQGRRSLPIVVLLALLVLATAVPMLVLLGWTFALESRAQSEAAGRLVRETSHTAASRALVFVESRVRLAASLSQRPLVRALDRGRCDPLLVDLPTIDDAVLEAVTRDDRGSPVCTAWQRPAEPAPWFAQLRAEGAAAVLPLERDTVLGMHSFSIAHPITAPDGDLQGAVELVIPGDALLPLINAPLPEGASIGLLDPANALASRFPLLPGSTGREIPYADAMRKLGSSAAGTLVAVGTDGVERLLSAHPVGRTGWIAFAGVPVEQVYGPARRAFTRSALVALFTVLGCVILVLLLARSITRPLSALRRTAQRAAAGDFSGNAPVSGPAELAAVAAGFNHMLERLPQLQRELQRSEERSRTLVAKLSRNVPGMIFTMHQAPDGRLRMPFASEALREMFELAPQEVEADASPAFQRIHPLDRPFVEAAMAAAAASTFAGATDRKLKVEYRVQLPRAGVQHRLSQAQPELQPDGSLLWYGCTVDVGPLKRSELALRDAHDLLEQRIDERTAALAAANDALEGFSYSVAHDLRAPLASIEGFTQAISESLQRGDVARAQGYCDRVAANAVRMNRLIEGFLALARAGGEPFTDTPVDMRRQVDEVLHDLHPPVHAQVEVRDLPRVRVDYATFRQVWQNLLSNALKYSSRQARPQVTVGWERGEQGELVFSVEDNGAGFDPAYADRLFLPFSRLHKADEFEGSGVGLAVVRRIVERHGGRIWAHSSAGRGATFCFSLPAERLLEPMQRLQ